MTKFRDGLVGPTVILLAICLVITFALANTYEVTLPIIKAAEEEKARTTRAKVLPKADDFTLLEGIELPGEIMEAYRANNGEGYVFKAGAKGFDGVVTFMVGVDSNGNYVGINMFKHNETPGLGTKVGKEKYLEQYAGKDDANSVDSVTGATKTSNALKNTLRACTEAYQQLEEVA